MTTDFVGNWLRNEAKKNATEEAENPFKHFFTAREQKEAYLFSIFAALSRYLCGLAIYKEGRKTKAKRRKFVEHFREFVEQLAASWSLTDIAIKRLVEQWPGGKAPTDTERIQILSAMLQPDYTPPEDPRELHLHAYILLYDVYSAPVTREAIALECYLDLALMKIVGSVSFALSSCFPAAVNVGRTGNAADKKGELKKPRKTRTKELFEQPVWVNETVPEKAETISRQLMAEGYEKVSEETVRLDIYKLLKGKPIT